MKKFIYAAIALTFAFALSSCVRMLGGTTGLSVPTAQLQPGEPTAVNLP